MAKDVRTRVAKEFPEFVGEVESLSVDRLNARIAKYAKESEASDKAKKENATINSAREKVRELVGPFNDFKKANRLKIQYMIEMIKDMGGDA